jgi:23S rRNA (adenine-N6)-dimethyltransferase
VAAPRRWGWHELDARWAARLVREAPVAPGDLVLDIGAGSGALSAALLAAGARVIAVEVHPGRAQLLRARFRSDLVVVQADASDLRLPRRPYKVVANPPFALTTVILKRLLQPGSRLLSADLVLPQYACRRWCGPDAPGAGRWQQGYRTSLGPAVPRSAFRPQPPAVPMVLRIERRGR